MAATRRRPSRPSLFRPAMLSLEDRAVPASLYVDNAFAALAPGATATFNPGQSNQVTGVVIGTNGFGTIAEAIDKANFATDQDSVFLANGIFTVDPVLNSGPLFVTSPVNLVGSGKAVTTIRPVSDSVALSGVDASIFNFNATTGNVSGLTFDGDSTNGKAINVAFRYDLGATGTLTNVAFANIRNTAAGRGIAVLGTDSGTVVIIDSSSFNNIGSSAVRFDAEASGTIQANTFVGHGPAAGATDLDANYGANITNGSNALITGNTFTGFIATGPNFGSAAIQVTSNDPTLPSTATIIGNTLDGNYTGIVVGNDATDTSTIDAQFNNIINNDGSAGLGSAIFTLNPAAKNIALNNFFGVPGGPGTSGNGNNNPGSSVSDGVTFTDPAITQPPGGIAQATLPVVVAATPANYLVQVAPTLTVTGQPIGTSSPITLTFTFSKPVTGFTASDIKLSGAVGTPVVNSVTDLGNGKYSVVVGGLNKRGTLTVNVAQGIAVDNIGLGNQVSSNPIAFQPPFDVGFGTSADAGIVTPTLGVVENTGTTRFGVAAFGPSFTGGVRTATADVTGDGTLDYIVASGPGRQAEVRVFDGATETQIFSFVPFGSTFVRGAYVSAGDLNGDGRAEIAITAERGGGARIRILNGNGFGQIADFIGIIGSNGVADTNFRGGARSAIGDFNGDGTNDLAFAAGTGGGPRVALFNGNGIATPARPKLTGDFFVFEPTLRDGSNVAAGDVNGDGKADLIVGAGNGAARVRVLSGATITASNGSSILPALADFFAFGSKGSTGVRVAARDLDLDGRADVIAGPGTGAGGSIRVYSSVNLLANPGSPAVTNTLNLYGSFTGGVFVG